MNLSPRAQKLMAQQKIKYIRSLPDKKARIERAWEQMQGQQCPGELFEKLKTEVHRLSGSAGSYGLTALGQAALALDVLLTGSSDIDLQKLNRLINTLLSALDVAIEKNGA